MSFDQEILDYTPSHQQATTARPVFITVLCILSFVGVGFTLLINVVAYIILKASADMLQEVQATGVEMDAAWNAVRYMDVNLAIGIGGALACLWGAILMWKLKRIGYYIYIVGQVVPLVLSFFILQTTMLDTLTFIFSALFPLIFIVLYGINLKHMK